MADFIRELLFAGLRKVKSPHHFEGHGSLTPRQNHLRSPVNSVTFTSMATDFTTLEKALQSLESALQHAPKNDLERDGVIQRFEYTFELSWKVAKRVLGDAGITATSPKGVIRELGSQGWITSVEQWFDFLRARNASTHTYVEKTASDVYQTSKLFAPRCRELIEKLKKQ